MLETSALIPEEWREIADSGVSHVFNPAIIRHGDGYVMAYRVVLADAIRRVATCRLTHTFEIDRDSIRPFSDHLHFAAGEHATTEWIADPRLFYSSDRLYMHFNARIVEYCHDIFIVEVHHESLLPTAPARVVVKTGYRRKVEKNWIFFESEGEIWAIYCMSPFTVMRVDMTGADKVVCSEEFRHAWDSEAYEEVFGELRGGATPFRVGGYLHAITHSVFTADPDAGRNGRDLVYVGASLVFDSKPPFVPVLFSARPLITLTEIERNLPNDSQLHPRCLEVIYPTGVAADEHGIVVSYGINDHNAALLQMSWPDYRKELVPTIIRSPVPRRRSTSTVPLTLEVSSQLCALKTSVLRASWWQAARRNPWHGRTDDIRSLSGFRPIHGNFGDLAAPNILSKLTGRKASLTTSGPKLLTVGSLIQSADDDDAIWGSGFNGSSDGFLRNAPNCLHVYAVRGPISYDLLRRRGFDMRRVSHLFDPVSLVASLFEDELAVARSSDTSMRRDFCIIPHFRDELALRRKHPQFDGFIKSPDSPFVEMMVHILRSELVISSSLHGLILAEALGIPAVWLRPLMGEDELKFYDYYYGTNRYNVVRAESLEEALRLKPMRLPSFDAQAMIGTFPSESDLEGMGILVHPDPIEPGTWIEMSSSMPPCVTLRSGFGHLEAGGVWSDGLEVAIDIFVGDLYGSDTNIELKVIPFLPRPERPPRALGFVGRDSIGQDRFASDALTTLVWSLKREHLRDEVVTLRIELPDAARPKDLSLGEDVRQLGMFLHALRLVPSCTIDLGQIHS